MTPTGVPEITQVPPTATSTSAPDTPLPPGLLPAAAVVEIVPVPADSAANNPITATIKFMTNTLDGPKATAVALMTSGLRDVPLHVPVRLRVRPTDQKAPGATADWQLTAPEGSKARVTKTAEEMASFTPDVPGYYKVDATLVSGGGKRGPLGSVQIYADTYVGAPGGRCATCHPAAAQAWAKTGHARILTELIDNARSPDVPTHYAETCIRCHTTGYYPGSANGGFADAQARTNWSFPTFVQIDAAGKKTAPSNWQAMPAQVKGLANIQCEDCHGPAKEHVESGARVVQASQAEGICNQCHNGGGYHLKGTDLKNARHSDAAAQAWTYPVGPSHQECVRCHSGNGYVSFLADPGNPAGWDNRAQPVVCSTCHDPHSDANPFQLRIAGKPAALPFEARDTGLSATCYECHNARTTSSDVAGSEPAWPHYSSVAEFLSDTGGVDYDRTISNSPHGAVVGTKPVPNPAAADDPEAPKFLFSKAGDEKGNVPGPCVVCHMWPTIEDRQNPNWHKVGGHSFNMVSPDGESEYPAACRQCHGDLQTFNMPARADYDGNGTVEGVQDEVAGLLRLLWQALEANGVQRVDGGYPYARLPNDSPDKVKNAWYNYRTVYGVMWGPEGVGNQGKAQAVHNFKRAVGLLQASYRDLTGADVPNAELMVR